MAKRKRTRRSRSRRIGGSSLMNTAIGCGGYILYEALLEPKVASVIGGGTMLNVAELIAASYLSRKSGVIGNVAKTAIVINVYQLVKPLLSGAMGGTNPIFS